MQLDDSGIKHFNTMQDLPTPLPARFANRPDMEGVRNGFSKSQFKVYGLFICTEGLLHR